MTIRVPTLATFTLASTAGRLPQPLINLGAAIHSSRLAQVFCWFLVFIL
jgi:hypothetical protein